MSDKQHFQQIALSLPAVPLYPHFTRWAGEMSNAYCRPIPLLQFCCDFAPGQAAYVRTDRAITQSTPPRRISEAVVLVAHGKLIPFVPVLYHFCTAFASVQCGRNTAPLRHFYLSLTPYHCSRFAADLLLAHSTQCPYLCLGFAWALKRYLWRTFGVFLPSCHCGGTVPFMQKYAGKST